MLCALPGGTSLLTGTSPEEEAAYLQRKDFPQADAIRAINVFGSALEKMSRGTDQRIELELAVFSLTQPMATARRPTHPDGRPAAAAGPGIFAAGAAADSAAHACPRRTCCYTACSPQTGAAQRGGPAGAVRILAQCTG